VTGGRADGSRVRTVFLGSGRFGIPALRRLVGDPAIDLVVVVTAPARPAGRGNRLTPTEVETTARALGIATIRTPERLRATEEIASVLDLGPSLAVLADFGQLVPPPLLELPHGALNLHPSLLPRHRGASPIPATILAGDRQTGVTLIRMDAGLDTGPIVAKRRLALAGTETAPDLEAALANIAADLLADRLGPWLGGELEADPQPVEGVTVTRPLRREDGRLDPLHAASELERQVRAYQPWPGSFVDTDLGRLTVWASRAGPATDRTPGRFGPDGLATMDGELILDEVQPAGGKRMAWDAFVRGRPGIVGGAALASDS
jgi:methionyl-tRNA formyltransferase